MVGKQCHELQQCLAQHHSVGPVARLASYSVAQFGEHFAGTLTK
jgi:hypothetical protein